MELEEDAGISDADKISETKYVVVRVHKEKEGSCISTSPAFERLSVPPMSQYQLGKNETERKIGRASCRERVF